MEIRLKVSRTNGREIEEIDRNTIIRSLEGYFGMHPQDLATSGQGLGWTLDAMQLIGESKGTISPETFAAITGQQQPCGAVYAEGVPPCSVDAAWPHEEHSNGEWHWRQPKDQHPHCHEGRLRPYPAESLEFGE
jgi:hypothetical protein